MSMHTPGPWSITRYYEPCNNRICNINIIADWYIIAKCGSEISSEITANAHLIAAAPLMLEALKEILPLWDREDVADTWSDTFEKIAHAINTAKGE